MSFPNFFEGVPRIAMRDPLAELLGASTEGRIEYAYLDAVKLAGHSCPTVAGAYLMSLKGLAALYDGGLPERGAIHVAFKEARSEGVTGVIANVIGLITGAAGEEGFKGLAGRHARCGLLTFEAPIEAEVRFAAGASAVEVSFDASAVPSTRDPRATLAAALRPDAPQSARELLADEFQTRVRTILIDRRDDPALVRVRRCA